MARGLFELVFSFHTHLHCECSVNIVPVIASIEEEEASFHKLSTILMTFGASHPEGRG